MHPEEVTGHLPKAFTSLRLSRSLPLSIWTMTYLPDVSWPGRMGSVINDYFTVASDLRWLCAAHWWQVQQNDQEGFRQRTFASQKLEDCLKRAHQHFGFGSQRCPCWISQPFEQWLKCRSRWQSRVRGPGLCGRVHNDRQVHDPSLCFRRYTCLLQTGGCRTYTWTTGWRSQAPALFVARRVRAESMDGLRRSWI